jgi:hypothetical protein
MAFAGSHTWRFNEVFTNASGTIQFIELRDLTGVSEIFVPGHLITTSTSPAHSYTIPPPNLTGPTS